LNAEGSEKVVDEVLTGVSVMCCLCFALLGTEVQHGKCSIWEWGWWYGVVRLHNGTVYLRL